MESSLNSAEKSRIESEIETKAIKITRDMSPDQSHTILQKSDFENFESNSVRSPDGECSARDELDQDDDVTVLAETDDVITKIDDVTTKIDDVTAKIENVVSIDVVKKLEDVKKRVLLQPAKNRSSSSIVEKRDDVTSDEPRPSTSRVVEFNMANEKDVRKFEKELKVNIEEQNLYLVGKYYSSSSCHFCLNAHNFASKSDKNTLLSLAESRVTRLSARLNSVFLSLLEAKL